MSVYFQCFCSPDALMFLNLYVPEQLCSKSCMFLKLYALEAPCSGSMLLKLYVPRTQCSRELRLSEETDSLIISVLCSLAVTPICWLLCIHIYLVSVCVSVCICLSLPVCLSPSVSVCLSVFLLPSLIQSHNQLS